MRYIALAQAWQDHGGKVNFLSHCENEILQQRIRSGTQAAGAAWCFSLPVPSTGREKKEILSNL
jgi:hypothetical protein